MWNKKEHAWHKSQLRKYTEELKESLKGVHSEKVQEIISKINQIDEYYSSVFIGDESIKNSIESSIETIDDYEEKYKDIEKYHNNLLSSDDEENSIQKEIQSAYGEILSYQSKLLEWNEEEDWLKQQIENKFDEIRKYYIEVYWQEEELDEEWNITQEKVSWIKNQLKDFQTKKEKEFDQLKENIESLLPGATSAWLSKAYKDMKDSFSWPKLVWNFIFMIVILIIIIWSKGIHVWDSLENTILNILPHLTYILPLVWLWYFASKKQSQAYRLEQEYAHKESLAKSFEWYKKQIDKLWEDEESLKIKQALMMNMVTMTWYNPSDTLDKNHWTNPPFWEYFFWWKDKK